MNIVFPKTGIFLMKVSLKIIFGHFCIFGLEKVTLGYWGQKTDRRAAKRPPTGKPKLSNYKVSGKRHAPDGFGQRARWK